MVYQLGKRLYAKRIVNVNVNIVLAGILALGPTVLIVHVTTTQGTTKWLGRQFGIKEELVINAITFFADVIWDVAIYFVLHWLANHWPRRAAQTLHLPQPQPIHPSFFKDATMVQVERMILSPFLYALSLGMQHILLVRQYDPMAATAIGFGIGIGTTRLLHTLWMLQQQRRAAEKAAKTAAAARHTTPVPPESPSQPTPPVHAKTPGGI